MARSRYARTPTSGSTMLSYVDPTRVNYLGADILDGVQVVDHLVSQGERLDTISAKYYGDEGYWWVIATANRIGFALGLAPGRTLKIPTDISAILDKLQR